VARKQRIKLDERVREDQEVKLSVFATRPSTMEPFHWPALFAETFLTFLLTYGALAILDREVVFGDDEIAIQMYKAGSAPFLIGVLVWG
jgi:glycerol uptake facilitator-like aquaporin